MRGDDIKTATSSVTHTIGIAAMKSGKREGEDCS